MSELINRLRASARVRNIGGDLLDEAADQLERLSEDGTKLRRELNDLTQTHRAQLAETARISSELSGMNGVARRQAEDVRVTRENLQGEIQQNNKLSGELAELRARRDFLVVENARLRRRDPAPRDLAWGPEEIAGMYARLGKLERNSKL